MFAYVYVTSAVWAEKTAYAKLTANNTAAETYTLTFLYEEHTPNGTDEWDVSNTAFNNSDSPYWVGKKRNITHVVFDASFKDARPTSCRRWFYDLYNTEFTSFTGLEHLNTSEVTDMSYMFYGCSALTALDLSSFNTAKVTNMGFMFSGCSSLTALDFRNFNTNNVTDMGAMFNNCGLTALDLSSFNTAKVTNMGWMFSGCSGLNALDLSSFNTANVQRMDYMFNRCSALTALDLSSFNTAKVTNMTWMFSVCSKLVSIYIGDEWNTEKVTVSNNMFYSCPSLVGEDGTMVGSVTDKTCAHAGAGGYMRYKNNSSTSIRAISTDNADSAPVYNLHGQRLAKPVRGLNIIGGKKMIVK